MATCQAPFQQQWKVRTAGARGDVRQVVRQELVWPISIFAVSLSSCCPCNAARSLIQHRAFSNQHLHLRCASASANRRHGSVHLEICTRVQARRRIRCGPLSAQAHAGEWGDEDTKRVHEESVSSMEQLSVQESPLTDGRDCREKQPTQLEEGRALDASEEEAPQAEEQGEGFSKFLSKAFWNIEWLHKSWDVPWGYRTTLAVFVGTQLLAGWVGHLAGSGVIHALGSELVGSQLQCFCSRVAAYLSVAIILEVFLANQKRLKESPFDNSSGGRWWRHFQWVALWLGFRLLVGGIASRGAVLPRMCQPPSTFPIEVLPNHVQSGWDVVDKVTVVEGLSAAAAGSIAKFAGTLNVALDLLVAPWFEEAFFRGFVQASLSKTEHPLVAILLTAWLHGNSMFARMGWCGVRFGVRHPPGLLFRWVSQSLLSSIVYGTVFQKTRSLLPGVLLHQLETLSRVLVVAYDRGPFWTTCRLSFLVLSSASR